MNSIVPTKNPNPKQRRSYNNKKVELQTETKHSNNNRQKNIQSNGPLLFRTENHEKTKKTNKSTTKWKTNK